MNKVISLVSNAFVYVLAIAETEQLLRIVELCLAILATIISIVFSILAWYKKAMKDGKIDKEEVKEVVDIVSDGVSNVKEQVKDVREEIKEYKQNKGEK